ncbi:hypothetical protein ABZ400_15670 [Streptomyces sp. NPDC005897]
MRAWPSATPTTTCLAHAAGHAVTLDARGGDLEFMRRSEDSD